MLGCVVGSVEQEDPFRKPVRLIAPRVLQDSIRRGIPRDLDQALAGEAQVLGDAVDARERLVGMRPPSCRWPTGCGEELEKDGVLVPHVGQGNARVYAACCGRSLRRQGRRVR